jgi:hypothetical protein
MAIETTPAFFGSLSELQDHRDRGLVRETSPGSHGAVAHRRERAFDDIRRCPFFLSNRNWRLVVSDAVVGGGGGVAGGVIQPSRE